MRIVSLSKTRKELVDAITVLTGKKMLYQGTPTLNFSNGTFTVTKDGSLEVDGLTGNEDVLKQLAAMNLIDNSWDENRKILSIDLPMRLHTATSLVHLLQIMWGKEKLINKAVGARLGFDISDDFIKRISKEPPTSVSEFLSLWEECGGEEVTKGISFDTEKIYFTAFPYTEDSEWVQTYMQLASAIHDESLNARRIKMDQPEVDNEKYYFRVWLLRIGLGGEEYKTARKCLLSNLTGNVAFKTEEQRLKHSEKHRRKLDHDSDRCDRQSE